MTSFTKKLFQRDPAAAEAFHRAQQFEHRLAYGKNVSLACFTPAHHQVAATFGRREQPPVLPAYECWSPLGKSKAVVRAVDSFQARKQYAAHTGLAVTDVCARRMGQ